MTAIAQTPTSRIQPRSMLMLRRAADAAGYAVAGSPEDEPARSRLHAPAPALMLASLLCVAGFAFAIT